jgi:cytidine deaminase
MKKKYFHEVIEEDQKILDIGLRESRKNKKERTKEKTVSELLQEGFKEEQENEE